MKNIAIITWSSYNNYGTLLQSYALQSHLKMMGYETRIISDAEILREHFHSGKQIFTEKNNAISYQSNNSKRKTSERLIQLAKDPSRWRRVFLLRINKEEYYRPYIEAQLTCDHFRMNDLRILYGYTRKNAPDLNEAFDAFVCGSDQIWSTRDRIFNTYYYLDFATKRKIAYAPSIGMNIIPKEFESIVLDQLRSYHALSVREKDTALQLSDLTGRKVEWVADPTLLVETKFWSDFAANSQRINKKYLLCYFLEDREWYFLYTRKLAKKLGLKVVLIPNRESFVRSDYIVKFGVGPKEFVSLFSNASYVLTDSYHGTIFSLIFNKDFQHFLRFSNNDPLSQNIRVNSLLEYLGLEDRIITEGCKDKVSLSIEYEAVNRKLEEFRSTSRNYLSQSLE